MKSIVVLLTLTYYLLTLFGQCHCQAYGCPNVKTWIRWRDTDRCFFFSPEHETYEAGKKFCESQHAQLAAPLTCTMQFDLNSLLANYRPRCRKYQNCEEFWIGIQSLDGKTWTTSKGFELDNNSSCLRWERHFPRGDGRCATLSFKESTKEGSWRNADCNKKFKFICIGCPNYYQYLPEINECVHLRRQPDTWEGARKTCAGMKWGARLLTIKSTIKEKAIARFLKPLLESEDSKVCGNSKYSSLGKLIWLGGQTTDPKKCDTPFIWKPPVTFPTSLRYTKWFPGMPKCATKEENCMVVATDTQQNYQWQDIPCNEKFCWVCEFN